MSKTKDYLVDLGHQVFHVTPKRFFMMLGGNLILALGLAMYNKAGMGNHPFHTMVYAASQLLHGGAIDWYSTIFWILNIFIFVPVLIFGKKHVGLGTIVNMLLLGYAVDLCEWLLGLMGINFAVEGARIIDLLLPRSVWQLILELGATIVISLGISVYQAGDMGAAPYDALPLMAMDRGKSFMLFRMICDGGCCLITLLELLLLGFDNADTHSMIGLGSIITVFCTGPFIRFFDKFVSSKLIGKEL